MLKAFKDGFTEFYDGTFEGQGAHDTIVGFPITVFRCKKDARYRIFPGTDSEETDFTSAAKFNSHIKQYGWVPAKLETHWRDLAAMIEKIRQNGDGWYLGE